MFKYFKYIFFTGLLLMLSGCYFDQHVSWSPDGRYVLYISLDNEYELWQFDTRTGKTEEIKLQLQPTKEKTWLSESLNKKLHGCRYLKDPSGILIITTNDELFLYNMKTGYCVLIDTYAELGLYVPEDGNGIYYIKESNSDKKKKYTLIEYRGGKKSPIFSREDEFVFPCISHDGDYILFSTDHSLNVYNVEKEISSVIISNEHGNYYYPKWVNRDEIVYIFIEDKDEKDVFDKGVGILCKLSIDLKKNKTASNPVIIKKNLYSAIPYSIRNYTHTAQAADKEIHTNTLKVTEPVVIASVMPSYDFIETEIISIKTGNVIWKSDSISPALSPRLSPDGNSLAYLSIIVSDFGYLETQNLKTGKRTIAWRNEEERLFAEAEALKQAEEFQMSLDKYQLITKQYPDTEIQKAASYNMAMLNLSPEVYDLDKAYSSIINLNEPDDLPSMLWKKLWRPEDRIVSDSTEDWIQTYSTAEAMEQFGINTDLTRDLRNLWMREGKEWLYIRIDYGSTLDIAGLAFQDTLLLFDYETPEVGSRSISEIAEWDKTADRKVLIRHWFESKEKSQYDLEIRNDKNEIIHKYLVSCFAPPDNPFFKNYRFQSKDNSYLVYAVSREILGLKSGNKINVQVCTFKGGIESQKKLEIPRFDPTKTLCDVADTFGEENNIERIKADKEKNPDKPIVIKGYAGTLELKK